MRAPERHFEPLVGVEPAIHEVLLVPFRMLDEAVGTVWIISHRPERRFDREDLRIIEGLSDFAAAAHMLATSLRNTREMNQELMRANERLRRANMKLSGTPSLD